MKKEEETKPEEGQSLETYSLFQPPSYLEPEKAGDGKLDSRIPPFVLLAPVVRASPHAGCQTAGFLHYDFYNTTQPRHQWLSPRHSGLFKIETKWTVLDTLRNYPLPHGTDN